MSFETACIFVDGENLRHSLVDLFSNEFNSFDYLPKNADWGKFFNSLIPKEGALRRLRTYWYVVDEIDFWPWGLQRLVKQDQRKLQTVLSYDTAFRRELAGIVTDLHRNTRAIEIAQELIARERRMKNRFDGWRIFQNGICNRFDSIEFRRAGSIRYNLFTQRLEKEKGVDVKLATDILHLKKIYTVGIIVSGDGDYVPAVQVAKDHGRHIVNVSFLKRDGLLLPGGARRLNQNTDSTIEIDYSEMRSFMRFPQRPATAAAVRTPPIPPATN
jgi:uncharacterized LabA/DUF88 family protein